MFHGWLCHSKVAHAAVIDGEPGIRPSTEPPLHVLIAEVRLEQTAYRLELGRYSLTSNQQLLAVNGYCDKVGYRDPNRRPAVNCSRQDCGAR